ncbi:MAG: DUF1367 family protein [Pedobacter sp.]|jgi:hypothetical protein
MKIVLVKTLSGSIIPAYDQDKEKLKQFKAGEPFMADVTKPRNLRFHKKAFALFNMVFQNQEVYTNLDDLRYDLTIEAGFFVEGSNFLGEPVKRPKSISFASMDDLEFGEYYEAIIKTIVRCFNFDRQDILDNVEDFA